MVEGNILPDIIENKRSIYQYLGGFHLDLGGFHPALFLRFVHCQRFPPTDHHCPIIMERFDNVLRRRVVAGVGNVIGSLGVAVGDTSLVSNCFRRLPLGRWGIGWQIMSHKGHFGL